mmetsp:Transcript_39814/g.88504  ORF Transcript_39814/g.88504 Transcript_39814/m.88504 type:complete len:1166 (+) Transcript_39814:378-3875(+)
MDSASEPFGMANTDTLETADALAHPLRPSAQDLPKQSSMKEVEHDWGGEVEGSDDEGYEAAHHAEEEERAKHVADALEKLNAMPVGACFSTIRVIKKNETLRQTLQPISLQDPLEAAPPLQHAFPEAAALPAAQFGSASPAPPAAGDDFLSALLPGPTFSPPSKFGAPAADGGDSGADGPGSSDVAGPSTPPQGEVESVATALPAEPPADDDELGRDSPPLTDDSIHGASTESNAIQGDAASEKRKAELMATWHYAEVTEDGGVAIAFDSVEELAEGIGFERLHQALLGHVEEQQEEQEEEDMAMLNQLIHQDGLPPEALAAVEGAVAAASSPELPSLPSLPSLPAPAFGTADAAMPGLTSVQEEGEGEVEERIPSVTIGLQIPAAPTATPSGTPPAVSPNRTRPVTPPQSGPSAIAFAGLSGPSTQSGPSAFSGPSVVPRPSLDATRPSSELGAMSKADMMKSIRQDFARTIREELKKSFKPGPSLAALAAIAAQEATPSARDSPAMSPVLLPPSARASPAVPPVVLQPTAARPTADKPGTPTSVALKAAQERMAAAKENLATPIVTPATPMELSIRVGFINGKIKPINIVMLVVGTRGDVQPFIGIALKLKEYGHRVRIASHKVYREFVTGFGLEFYPLGGDPKVLSEFVVKHRGIMPGLDVKDALAQRAQVKEILYSSWGACVQADPENPHKPFVAEAIVANPPAYGHSHCAEKLNVPLHIIFTMPWTPTKFFPNPFARIKTTIGETNSKAREVMNWLSYFAVEDLAWLGMSGMVKHFRTQVLGLKDWMKQHTSHALYHSKVPFTYIWSPSLVDRPSDWPTYCEVVGFINVELNKLTNYKPPKELADFLAAGPPPVYIGFGSLVVDDPKKLTNQFLEGIRRTGLRAIIQKGWGGLGAGVRSNPENVLFIDGAPHDWLFDKCCAVVHHGGAGTTATGLYAGKPTFIVTFFGDQPFWGAACFRAGVGPAPVPIDDLNTDKIIDALKTLILPTCQQAAKRIQGLMKQEDGIAGTVDHLHRTIYGTLMGGHRPLWMKPHGKQAGVPDTTIKASASEQLTGGLSFPARIARRMSTLFGRKLDGPPSQIASRTASGVVSQVNGSMVSRSPMQGTASMPTAINHNNSGPSIVMPDGPTTPEQQRQQQRPPPIVVEAPASKRGFFAFLGC